MDELKGLEQMVKKYEDMLERALGEVEVAAMENSFLFRAGCDLVGMARAYHDDGVFFMEKGEHARALVCFSYGHGFLDAGVRLGVLSASSASLFTI
ncbi:MAG: DUF357 domain-containing protein [Methermicoccaceae archaeon]